jgi:Mg2+-importing ATPase
MAFHRRKSFNLFRYVFKHSKINDKPLQEKLSKTLSHFSDLNPSELYSNLHSREDGLTAFEAERKLRKYGLNVALHDKPPTASALFFKNFTNPFVVLLILLSITSFFLQEFDAVIIIVTMVAISIFIRFIQEFRSHNAAEKLKELVSTKATLLRKEDLSSKSNAIDIDIKNIVPGDILHLSAGDMIPADIRILTSKDLHISQAALTGEAFPVEKQAANSLKKEGSLLDTPNLCFMGTNVLNGSATAIVLKTGNETYFGSMAKSITNYRPLTSFDLGLNKVTWLLIRVMLVIAPLVFIINGYMKDDWLTALLFAMSVAVGLTPEMLPMIVTANLAKGAVNLSKSKAIVKHLNAIQNFGAMDILCTDKTGTLTEDRIILDKYLNLSGKEDEEVLRFAFLNSFHQTGLKNLLDQAILDHQEIKPSIENLYTKIDEIPFDFNRRRMSVVFETTDKKELLICKGAVDEILQVCTQAKINGLLSPLTDETKKCILGLIKDLNEDGMRVLAVAYKEIASPSKKEYHEKDEEALTIVGVLAFLDPPKEHASQAIKNLESYNVQVKVLTGDNELITRKICSWVNLDTENMLTGHQIEEMAEEDLQKAVEKTTIFAKLSPLQKSRVIASLKKNGHTVGYLGDGINDAPALREADIGISVNTAVDIAKESADIIMLEKSLLFLAEGVLEGRKTFCNIIKYIKMAVSSNFGNVFSLLGASLLFPFLPMLPVQLLVQNLLYDLSQGAIPFDNVDKDFLMKPRKWDPAGISRFMVFIGPISSIFDYTTFAVLWFFIGANTIATQATFQSGWFIEGLLSQTLIVHMIRTKKIPFLQSIASLPLLATTFSVISIGIYIPYSSIGKTIGLVPLPMTYFPYLLGILLFYCLLTQLVKNWFIKKFHYWL